MAADGIVFGQVWWFLVVCGCELQNKLLSVINAHPQPKMQASFGASLDCSSRFLAGERGQPTFHEIEQNRFIKDP